VFLELLFALTSDSALPASDETQSDEPVIKTELRQDNKVTEHKQATFTHFYITLKKETLFSCETL
jgi:hypothetical protein